MSSRSAFLETTLPLILIGALNLAVALLYQAVLASTYGAGAALDTFFMANAIPGFLNNWLLWGAANVVLVPVLCSPPEERSRDESLHLANTFVTVVMIIGVVLSGICILFAPFLLRAMAPGFSGEQIALGARILRILSATIVLTAAVSVIRGILNAESIYISPYLAVTGYFAFLVAFVPAAAPRFGIWAVAGGTVAGTGLLLLLHLVPLRRVRFAFRFSLDPSVLRGPLLIFFTYMVVNVAAHITFIVDRYFASRLPDGSIALLSLAQKFQIPIVFLFAFAVSVPALTVLSNTRRERDKFVAEIRRSIHTLSVVVVPFVVFLTVLRGPLARLWFEHGAFGPDDTRVVGTVILCLAPAFLVNAYSALLLNGYFVLGSFRLVLPIAFVETALNIVLNALLVDTYGLAGIAVATSVATGIVNGVLWVALHRRLKGFGFRKDGEVGRLVGWCVLIASFILGLDHLSRALGGAFFEGRPGRYVAWMATVSLVGFLVTGFGFRLEEFRAVSGRLRKRRSGAGDP